MKRKFLVIEICLLMLLLVACGNPNGKEETVVETQSQVVESYQKDDEKIMEIMNFVKNHKHFDFMKNVKINEDKEFYQILNMEEDEYFSKFDRAANLHYSLGDIYLFHMDDVSNMGNVMMKTINLKGITMDNESRDYKARYMVATCGNYLIVAFVNVENSNETKELISIFYEYFGKDNLENVYELLLEPRQK